MRCDKPKNERFGSDKAESEEVSHPVHCLLFMEDTKQMKKELSDLGTCLDYVYTPSMLKADAKRKKRDEF